MGTGRKVGKRWLKSERAIMRASYMCMERAWPVVSRNSSRL